MYNEFPNIAQGCIDATPCRIACDFFGEAKCQGYTHYADPCYCDIAGPEFTEEDVQYWKTKAHKYFTEYVEPKIENIEDGGEIADRDGETVSPTKMDSQMPY